MTVDELISKLEELKKQHGGETDVYCHDSERETVLITVVYEEDGNIYMG